MLHLIYFGNHRDLRFYYFVLTVHWIQWIAAVLCFFFVVVVITEKFIATTVLTGKTQTCVLRNVTERRAIAFILPNPHMAPSNEDGNSRTNKRVSIATILFCCFGTTNICNHCDIFHFNRATTRGHFDSCCHNCLFSLVNLTVNNQLKVLVL